MDARLACSEVRAQFSGLTSFRIRARWSERVTGLLMVLKFNRCFPARDDAPRQPQEKPCDTAARFPRARGHGMDAAHQRVGSFLGSRMAHVVKFPPVDFSELVLKVSECFIPRNRFAHAGALSPCVLIKRAKKLAQVFRACSFRWHRLGAAIRLMVGKHFLERGDSVLRYSIRGEGVRFLSGAPRKSSCNRARRRFSSELFRCAGKHEVSFVSFGETRKPSASCRTEGLFFAREPHRPAATRASWACKASRWRKTSVPPANAGEGTEKGCKVLKAR